MTLEYALAFTVAMLIWATLPGPGLAVVVSRVLGSGPKAGFAVVTGLVIADFIFLGIAFIGLLAIATTMAPVFQCVKYAGAAYLIWRGYRLFVGTENPMEIKARPNSVFWQDVGLGLLATLGNPKAILFFGAILPTFVDMAKVGLVEFLILAGIVIAVSYFVYGACIVLSDRTRHLMASTKAVRYLRRIVGTLLIGSGIVVATR